jgi:hypothetical protein
VEGVEFDAGEYGTYLTLVMIFQFLYLM